MEYQNPEKYKNYWKTKISKIDQNYITIRGYPLHELTGQIPYVDAIILHVRGELPDEVESKTVNAIFTAAMDHQFLNSTALAARVVVSANPDPVNGIAAGILAFGKVTAGVPTYVVEMLNEYHPGSKDPEAFLEAGKKLISDFRGRGARIWGYGHPLHPPINEHYTYRSQLLRDQIEVAGLPVDDMVLFYETVHGEFQRVLNRQLPINVDGVMGAAFAELRYDPLDVQGLAVFTMLPGIVAHAVEEIREGVPLRIVPESEYIGVEERSRFAAGVRS